MKVYRPTEFRGEKAWQAQDICAVNGITCRLHWTDQPYIWHVNDGEEIFAVLDGTVKMHVRKDGKEETIALKTGDVFYAGEGDEHYAEPVGEARILVIEKEGSI